MKTIAIETTNMAQYMDILFLLKNLDMKWSGGREITYHTSEEEANYLQLADEDDEVTIFVDLENNDIKVGSSMDLTSEDALFSYSQGSEFLLKH